MIKDLHRVIQLIEGDWRNTRVLVVGDIMLDRYIWGDVERISPEAPVPVVRAAHRTEQPGGAANVAMNIAGLGAKATLFGFCGDDPDRLALAMCLRKAGVADQMTPVPTHPTTSKLRILGGRQQMLRLDMELTQGYPPEAYETLLAKIEAMLAEANAVVLSDYAKGVLTEEVCSRLISASRARNIPVLVDPKQRSFSRYRGATTICPNLAELSATTGLSPRDIDAVLAAGQMLIPELELESIIATLSEKGIALLRKDSKTIAPAVARQVFDVSGAGDTVIAILALAVASGLDMETAIQLANVAAGIVVSNTYMSATTYSGVDDAFFAQVPQRESATDAFRMLFAGSFEKRKGAETLISALGCLNNIPWQLEIAGPLDTGVVDRHREFFVDARVTCLGLLSRPDLAKAMSRADVFIFPSLAEGSARVIFEALACGCFVITTPNSGSIVEEGVHGSVVSAGDSSSLARAVENAFEAATLFQ